MTMAIAYNVTNFTAMALCCTVPLKISLKYGTWCTYFFNFMVAQRGHLVIFELPFWGLETMNAFTEIHERIELMPIFCFVYQYLLDLLGNGMSEVQL